MEAPSQTEQYHLVCRECQLERLCDTAPDANALRREHAEATGHRIAVDRIK